MGNTRSVSMLNHSPRRFVCGRIVWKASSTASMSSTRTDSTIWISTMLLPGSVFSRRTTDLSVCPPCSSLGALPARPHRRSPACSRSQHPQQWLCLPPCYKNCGCDVSDGVLVGRMQHRRLRSLRFGRFRPTMPTMRSEELIRQLRRYARVNGLVFSVVSRRGKGSHVLVCVGSRRSFVPSSRELPAGTRRAILRQLGVSPSDLERIRPPPQPRQA